MVDRRTTPRGSLTPARPAASESGLPPVDVGLYGPDSEAWRLNREAMLLLGAGPRALLLQIAHPLIAEGVDQHSDFRADPWPRLAATLRSYLMIVYGSGFQARAEIRRLNALHRGIEGPVEDDAARAAHGTRYSARDPELALWVHATLIDSTIAAYDAWIEPLSHERRARFYAEMRPIGRAFGIPDAVLPADIDDFDSYVAGMLAPSGPVRVSATARDLAGFILRSPLGGALPGVPLASRWLGRIPAGAYAWTLLPSIGLLPESVRDEYGLAWGPTERAVSSWLSAGLRAWRPMVPPGLRWMPQARAADRRVSTAPGTAARRSA